MPLRSHSVAAQLSSSDVAVGQTVSIERTIQSEDLDTFAALTGDYNPLHMSAEFAAERAHPRRVVHGMLLAGLMSQMAGMYLPGRDCLLQSVQIDFVKLAYAGDTVRLVGEVAQVQPALRTVKVRVTVLRGDEVVARGKYWAEFHV